MSADRASCVLLGRAQHCTTSFLNQMHGLFGSWQYFVALAALAACLISPSHSLGQTLPTPAG
jgi:hypothetical protein